MHVVDGLVSVIIPTYQQEHLVRQTIASVQSQTYERLQIIVSDDASTDGTPDVVAELAREDARIELLRAGVNGGITANCNRALAVARGELVAWLGGDDLWLASKIEKQRRVFASDARISLVGTDVEVFFDDGTPPRVVRSSVMRRGGSLEDFVRAPSHIPTSSFVYRRSAMPELVCDARLRVVSDWLFNVECAARGRLGYVPEVLTRYRRWSGNVTAAGSGRAHLDDRLIATDILLAAHPELCSALMVARMNVLLHAGLRHLRDDDLAGARRHFRAAGRQRPGDARPWLLLALARARVNPYRSHRLRAAGRAARRALLGGP